MGHSIQRKSCCIVLSLSREKCHMWSIST